MKKLFLLTIVLTCIRPVFAQHQRPQGEMAVQGSGTGSVLGKITDSLGNSISDVSIVLLGMQYDSVTQLYKAKLFKGVLANSKGDFIIEDIPLNKPFQLKISVAGYVTKSMFIALKPDEIVMNIGNIVLADAVKVLQEVVVKGISSMLKLETDKLVFNVEKSMQTAGGTAMDIMRYVPSVQSDIDGNVRLRNATPQIFIDGRPSTLSLDQIPADAIESVEVIANPSAKYDASGGNAGILNLIMKKNRKKGYNVNIRTGIDRRGALNGGADFNLRTGKINFSSALTGSQSRSYINGTTDQFNAFVIPHEQVHQEIRSKLLGDVLFGKFGMDYFINSRMTLSANLIKSAWKFRPIDEISSSILLSNGIQKYAFRKSEATRTFKPTGWQFGLKHLFPKAGNEITAAATYFTGPNRMESYFSTDSMNSASNIYTNEQQSVNISGYYKLLTLQTDFATNIGGQKKIELGLRASLKSMGSENDTKVSSNNMGFVSIPNAGNNYINHDNVYAAYGILSETVNRLNYQIGLRAERSEYRGIITTTQDQFSYKYPINLFPSVFITQKFKKDQQLQFSYTKRISRPTFFNLIPFVDRTDPLNYSRGNPDLRPEFTQSLNLSFSRMLKTGGSLLFSTYYKYTRQLITRYQVKEFDPVTQKDVLVNTYVNANNSFTYGVEFVSAVRISKWWDITMNLNGYQSKIDTKNVSQLDQESIFSWFGKWNNNFTLPNGLIIQLSGMYQSKSNLPVGTTSDGGHMAQTLSASQGYIKPFYSIDISFRKSFLKNKAAVVMLGFSDIFRSRWQNQHSENGYFIQDYSRIKDPQMIRLSIAYRFGKVDLSLFKRKNMKAESESIQGAMQ